MARRRIAQKGGYHHGELRNALVAAGSEVIADLGPTALTMREVAARAGVTPMACYRHFANKEALLAAVAAHGMRRISRAMRRAAGSESDPLNQLTAIALTYVRFADRNRAQFRVIFGPEAADKSAYPEVGAAAEEGFQILREAMRAAQKSGRFRQDGADELALQAWVSIHGLASLIVDGQIPLTGLSQRKADELVRRVVVGLFLGLAPR